MLCTGCGNANVVREGYYWCVLAICLGLYEVRRSFASHCQSCSRWWWIWYLWHKVNSQHHLCCVWPKTYATFSCLPQMFMFEFLCAITLISIVEFLCIGTVGTICNMGKHMSNYHISCHMQEVFNTVHKLYYGNMARLLPVFVIASFSTQRLPTWQQIVEYIASLNKHVCVMVPLLYDLIWCVQAAIWPCWEES
jgi:hypothetical protein